MHFCQCKLSWAFKVILEKPGFLPKMLHFWTGCHNEAVIRQSLHLPEGPDLTFQSVTHPLPSALSSLRGQPFPMNTRVFKIALSEQGELGATESLSQTYQNSAAGTHCPVCSMKSCPGLQQPVQTWKERRLVNFYFKSCKKVFSILDVCNFSWGSPFSFMIAIDVPLLIYKFYICVYIIHSVRIIYNVYIL